MVSYGKLYQNRSSAVEKACVQEQTITCKQKEGTKDMWISNITEKSQQLPKAMTKKRRKEKTSVVAEIRRSPRLMNKPRVDYRPMLGMRIPKSERQSRANHVECLVRDVGMHYTTHTGSAQTTVPPRLSQTGERKWKSQFTAPTELSLSNEAERITDSEKSKRERRSRKKISSSAPLPEESIVHLHTMTLQNESQYPKKNKREKRATKASLLENYIFGPESMPNQAQVHLPKKDKKCMRSYRASKGGTHPTTIAKENSFQTQTVTSLNEPYFTCTDAHQEIPSGSVAVAEISGQVIPYVGAVAEECFATEQRGTPEVVIATESDQLTVSALGHHAGRAKQAGTNNENIANSTTSFVNERALVAPRKDEIFFTTTAENPLTDITTGVVNAAIEERNAPSGSQFLEVPDAVIKDEGCNKTAISEEHSVEHVHQGHTISSPEEQHLSGYDESEPADDGGNTVNPSIEREVLVRDVNFAHASSQNEHPGQYHQMGNMLMVQPAQGPMVPVLGYILNEMPEMSLVSQTRFKRHCRSAAQILIRHYPSPYTMHNIETVIQQSFLGISPLEFHYAVKTVKDALEMRFGRGIVVDSQYAHGYQNYQLPYNYGNNTLL